MVNTLDDPGQKMVKQILTSGANFSTKVFQLGAVEKQIEILYGRGLTNVKPCRLLTPDDLVH